jgi:hypothetical protein
VFVGVGVKRLVPQFSSALFCCCLGGFSAMNRLPASRAEAGTSHARTPPINARCPRSDRDKSVAFVDCNGSDGGCGWGYCGCGCGCGDDDDACDEECFYMYSELETTRAFIQ